MSDRIIHSVLTATVLLGYGTGTPSVDAFPYSSRIYKGNNAEKAGHPYMVTISIEAGDSPKSYQFICGGVILDELTVLTSSHCFDSHPLTGRRLDPEYRYRITAGEYDMIEDDEKSEQKREFRGSDIIIHDNYTRGMYYNDIAIIRLPEEPLHFNKFVGCINLPHPNKTYDDARGVIAGWGQTMNSTDTSRILQDVDVTIHCKTLCERQWGNDFDADYMLCAGGDAEDGDRKFTADACYGDSGGPLVYQSESDNKKYVVGLVSWGYHCGYIDFPGVYTRVSKHIDWINQKVPELEVCCNRRKRRFNSRNSRKGCNNHRAPKPKHHHHHHHHRESHSFRE